MQWLLILCTLIPLLIVVGVRGGRRRSYPRIATDYRIPSIKASVGTPPQRVFLILDPAFSDVVLFGCALEFPARAMKCPRFCDNGMIRRMFCRTLCQKPSRSWNCIDGNPSYRNSSTFRDSNDDLQITSIRYRPFYGFRGSDTLNIRNFVYNKTYTFTPGRNVRAERTDLRIGDEEMVIGLSSEIRAITQKNGILGVQPGRQSFVPRLKAQGHIDRAIISIQGDSYTDYAATYVRALSTVMFGALDKSVCIWKWVPAYNSDGWSFQIDDVKFVDTFTRGPSIARLAIDSDLIYIPHNIIEHYVRMGLLIVDYEFDRSRKFNIAAENQSALSLEFQIDDQLIQLTPVILMMASSYNRTVLAEIEDRRYNTEAEWVFGTRLLDYFCFGYDYDLGRVAWGRRRRPEIDLLEHDAVPNH